jgi:NAD-dependent DNA ligase
MGNFESQANKLIDRDINMIVPWYLLASYAYYVEDDPIFSDSFYDNLSRKFKEEWENINHFHRNLITLDDLSAGTYLGKYPNRVIGSLANLRKSIDNPS